MGESHIVPMPKGFLAVRILQIIFALMVIGLTAFLISNTIGFVFSATAFGIFCGILTLIIITYDLVAEKAAKGAYNMWAILALDIVMVIFWLSAMGSLAALRAAFTVPVDIYYKRSLLQKRYVYAWAGDTYLAILAASAGIAAIELILFIISLIMFSARLHRHRTSSRQQPQVTALHVSPEKIELQQQQGGAHPAPAYPNYQPPAMQHPSQQMYPQQTITPVYGAPQQPSSPAHGYSAPTPPPQQVYPVPAMSPPPAQGFQSPPPPQFAQPVPQQYAPAPVPQGYHEAPGMMGHGQH